MDKMFELVNQYPDLNLTVKAGELIEMVKYVVKLSSQELRQQVAEVKSETYLTRDEVAKMLGVDKSTLWRWNKRDYLTHIELGGKRLYRMSDVKRILEGGR